MNDRTQPPGTAPMDVVSDPSPRQRMRRLRKHLLPLQSESISPIDLPSVRTGLLTKLNALTVGLIALTAACDLRLLLLAAVGRAKAASCASAAARSRQSSPSNRSSASTPRTARRSSRCSRALPTIATSRTSSWCDRKLASDRRATVLAIARQRADPGAPRELRRCRNRARWSSSSRRSAAGAISSWSRRSVIRKPALRARSRRLPPRRPSGRRSKTDRRSATCVWVSRSSGSAKRWRRRRSAR